MEMCARCIMPIGHVNTRKLYLLFLSLQGKHLCTFFKCHVFKRKFDYFDNSFVPYLEKSTEILFSFIKTQFQLKLMKLGVL